VKDIIARHKAGEHLGICSVCSAHPLVIEAALRFDLDTTNKVLIEATSNQVNQFGGYTGMQPADFRDFVLNIAKEVGFPQERLILGGDHLGPNCWQNEPADAAMEKSIELIKAYVVPDLARSTWMLRCPAPTIRSSPAKVVAQRAARLCKAAEETATMNKKRH
jgi:D-tagatose-1,6-bisphosphate aldolase subunit GatZ/KbaZ